MAEVFYNGYTGSYIDQYALFFTKASDLTGYHGGFSVAHFWFLLYLFVISLTALLIIILKKKYLPGFRVSSDSYLFVIFLFVPEWLCQYVLNIAGKSLGQFMILFLFGYFILSEEKTMEKIKQYRYISLALCIVSGCIYTYLYCFENLRNELMTGLYIFYGWMGIITLLGIGQAKLNFHNRLSHYLTRASFPVYILHMPVLAAVGFFVLKFPLGVAGQFLTIMLSSSVLTFLIYEIIKRVPVLGFFLGIPEQKS